MSEWTLFGRQIGEFLTADEIKVLLRVVVFAAVGFPLVLMLTRLARRYVTRHYSPQQGMVAGKLIFYLGFTILAVSVLNELGFSLSPLLGAAGIIGIAIGFASQTSVSNIISGVFLIAEQPFVVGDLISVGSTRGYVLSIDVLSVKLRTFDNRFVRIPNEFLVKSEVTNITRFPIRRLDVQVSVAYKEEIGRVRDLLMQIAHDHPLALQKPAPDVIFSGFGQSSVDLLFVVWVTRQEYLALKYGLQEEIKRRFDEACVEIPFPHISLYSGSATEPFPVKMVEEKEE